MLALFAKAPEAGRVKTRLTPPLSPGQAAGLYEAMLCDILEQHAAGEPEERALWFTPPGARPWFEAAAEGRYRLYVQEGADLGARMREVFRRHAAEGFDRIVLRGTDSPTLPPATVGQAFAALEAADAVICPDRDGGYNLVGLREPAGALFELPMSTATVLEQTRAAARRLGLSLRLLPAHHDVDTAADLELLAREVSGAGAPRAPRTAEWLRRHPRAEG